MILVKILGVLICGIIFLNELAAQGSILLSLLRGRYDGLESAERLRQARALLTIGVVSVWLTSILVWLADGMVSPAKSVYTPMLLTAMGMLLLVMSAGRGVTGALVLWHRRSGGKNIQSYTATITIYFIFALIMWVTAWFFG